MTVRFRLAAARDAHALLSVRAATLENPFSLEALAAAGITTASVADGLERAVLAGWVAEDGHEVAGFCLADLPAGELWVLAVLPGHEGRGMGRELLARTEELLWQAGHRSAWLWTSPDRTLRAYHLYASTGWQETELHAGRLSMRKAAPETRAKSV